MSKDIFSRGVVVPLTEKNGAPRHDHDKLSAIVQHAVEQALEARDTKVLSAFEAVNEKLERSVNRLLENIEGLVLGEHDLAVASVVDTEADDLPRLSSAKASPTVIYNCKTSTIAASLGLSTGAVSFLLNRSGLDWVTRKPELWDKTLYGISHTRLWHRSTTRLLREVILNRSNAERENVSAACERALIRAEAIITSCQERT